MMFGYLKEAASYLIVLHTMEPVEQSSQVSPSVLFLRPHQHMPRTPCDYSKQRNMPGIGL